jgi:hypothetical protein
MNVLHTFYSACVHMHPLCLHCHRQEQRKLLNLGLESSPGRLFTQLTARQGPFATAWCSASRLNVENLVGSHGYGGLVHFILVALLSIGFRFRMLMVYGCMDVTSRISPLVSHVVHDAWYNLP